MYEVKEKAPISNLFFSQSCPNNCDFNISDHSAIIVDSLVTLLIKEGEKTRCSTRLGKCPSWKRDMRMLTVASGELRAFSSSTISSLEKN